MKRKIASIMICAAMAAVLSAGCSSSGGSGAANNGVAESNGTAEGNTAADAGSDAEDADGRDDGSIVVGFAQAGHDSDWLNASTQSCQDVFSSANGYDLQVVDCDNDPAAQIAAVNSFIQQKVDYIIINPIVSTGWDAVLTECEDAKIPVIVIDRTIDDSDKYVSWVGSDFKAEGLAAGEWLKAYAAEKGINRIDALVIEGPKAAPETAGRTDGFKETAQANDWTILDSQAGDFTEVGGKEVMESYIESYKDQFNVVVCQNDNEAFGAIAALAGAGIEYGADKDVIIISFDACTAGLERVISGEINADFEHNPVAAPDVEKVIKQLLAGETPEKVVYVAERWYVNEDILSSITVGGEVQELIVVTQDIIDAQY